MNKSIKLLKTYKDEILSLDRVKQYLRVDNNADDEMIKQMIAIAIESAENYIGNSIKMKDYQIIIYNNFENKINLIHKPINFIKQIKIEKNSGETIYLSKNSYHFDKQFLYINNCNINFKMAEIIYSVGYEEIPLTLIQGILEHTAKLYDLRGSDHSMPLAAKSLYQAHKTVRL